MASLDATPAAPGPHWISAGEQVAVGDSAMVPNLLESERSGVAAVIAASIAATPPRKEPNLQYRLVAGYSDRREQT